MSRNGSGTYSPPASSFPAVANTLIESTKFNNVVNDIGSEITKSIANDGQTPVLANLPMSGFKHTGAAAASANGEYIEYAQFNTTVATLETQAHAAATYLSKVKIGQIVRAMSSASGSQVVDTLGFTPKAIRFFWVVDGALTGGQSQSDGTTTTGMYIRPDTGVYEITGNAVVAVKGSGLSQTAVVASLDANGFTLTWTKLGAPTGTLYLNWEAIA